MNPGAYFPLVFLLWRKVYFNIFNRFLTLGCCVLLTKFRESYSVSCLALSALVRGQRHPVRAQLWGRHPGTGCTRPERGNWDLGCHFLCELEVFGLEKKKPKGEK